MYKNWSSIGNRKYYFDPDKGILLTGWLNLGGHSYYLSPDDGHMYQGWSTIGGYKYYFSPGDGHMYKNWSNIDGNKYYFDPDNGHMYTGSRYIGGEEYDFGSNGVARKVVTRQQSSASVSSSYGSYGDYVGNRNTKKFHHSWCPSVKTMKNSNKVYFDSRSAAASSGYDPCQRCSP
jgi:hypothetical protein